MLKQHEGRTAISPYLPSFPAGVERHVNRVMTLLGVGNAKVTCLLVGFRVEDSELCIEPEAESRRLASDFDNFPARVEHHVTNNPLSETPEKIQRDAIRSALLDEFRDDDRVRSFVAMPELLNGFYLATVLRVPKELFERYRPLHGPLKEGRYRAPLSLIEAATRVVLDAANAAIRDGNPGKAVADPLPESPEESARKAATSFMYTPGIAIKCRTSQGYSLFERFNVISSLMYERTEGKGRLLLANSNSNAVDLQLTLAWPVLLGDARWSRKLLEMASEDMALVADCDRIRGLGNVAADCNPRLTQDVFEIEFHGHYHWSLSCGGEVLLVSKFGAPSLPYDAGISTVVDTYSRLFKVPPEDVASFQALYETAIRLPHGNMLVVAADAASEAERLHGQGTKIHPVKLTPELYKRVSNIDGTILIDPQCVCHAIGVILDGPADKDCTPSRGARYNSGIRYVAASSARRLSIVVSDDKTVDIIPLLRPRIRKDAVEQELAKLESSSVDNYTQPLWWLNDHRFYLDELQCLRANAELRRLRETPLDPCELQRSLPPDFEPDPACSTDFFEWDDAEGM